MLSQEVAARSAQEGLARAQLARALMEGDYDRAAAVECSCELRGDVVHAERASARREPVAASRAFTFMAAALVQRGKYPDAVAMLTHEAKIAKDISEDMRSRGCLPTELEVLERCLVRPDREERYEQCRETSRNELYDLFGVWVGSSLGIRQAVDNELKKYQRKRKRMQDGKEEKDVAATAELERLREEAEQLEGVLRREARQILLHKLWEERMRVSVAGQAPHEDGCWISWRGTEAFNGADGPTPVRKAFTELLKNMQRLSFNAKNRLAVRDRYSLGFADTLYYAYTKWLAPQGAGAVAGRGPG
jgi:hypothetical protein